MVLLEPICILCSRYSATILEYISTLDWLPKSAALHDGPHQSEQILLLVFAAAFHVLENQEEQDGPSSSLLTAAEDALSATSRDSEDWLMARLESDAHSCD
jgi:hypothetical protein